MALGGGLVTKNQREGLLSTLPLPHPPPQGKAASAIFRAFDPLLEIETPGIDRERLWGAELGPTPTP